MIYFYSFIVSGTFCLIGQIILSNTKLTAGHVTSLFAVFGSALSFLGLYEKLISLAGMGAVGIITNFGSSLFLSAYKGYETFGILGIFTEFLNKSSLVIVATILFSFITLLFFSSKE